MKSDQEFLDEIYEKAKLQLEQKNEIPVIKTRRKQRKFMAAAAVIVLVLISLPVFSFHNFSMNGNTINNEDMIDDSSNQKNSQRIAQKGIAKTRMVEPDNMDNAVKTFYSFYGTVTKIEEVSKKRIVSLLVEVNPDTGVSLFEGDTIELLDINKLVKESLIGSRLIFEVTQEGEEYQIDNYIAVE